MWTCQTTTKQFLKCLWMLILGYTQVPNFRRKLTLASDTKQCNLFIEKETERNNSARVIKFKITFLGST